MKQVLIKILSLFLVCVMICSALASCVEEPVTEDTGTEPPTETETEAKTEPSNKPTETEGESEETETQSKVTETETELKVTETDTETETETEKEKETVAPIPGLDNSPVEIDTTPISQTPDTENISKDTFKPYEIVVEGEDYKADATTLENIQILDSIGMSEDKVLYSVYVPEEWMAEGFDIKNWGKTIKITYEVTVFYAGYYNVQIAAGDRDKANTSNYTLKIDSKQAFSVKDATIASEVTANNETIKNMLQVVDFGRVYLKTGKRTFTIEIDLEDAFADRPDTEKEYGAIAFVIDYIKLTRVHAQTDTPVISYDADIAKDKNANILNASAKNNVFDKSYPIKIEYTHLFTKDESVPFFILDYAGNVIVRKYLAGKANEVTSITEVFNNHPTGYFKIVVGEDEYYYVVTPSFADRTVTDSPFAIDGNIAHPQRMTAELAEAYAAAFRLAGVTWTRERIGWAYYQYQNDDGSFRYSESYMNDTLKPQFGAIKSTGMNILAVFSSGPDWANKLPLGAGADETILRNTLGLYGTQLPVYEATNRLATELRGYVDILELANEPDHTYRDIAETYAGWFKAAALGIIDANKKANEAENANPDDDIIISISGMCQPVNWRDFTGLMMSSEVEKYTAIYNYHSHTSLPTGNSTPDFAGNSINIRTYPQALELYGNEKPVWISESGMKIPTLEPSEDQKTKQTPYIVTSAIQALSYGTDKYFWFVGTHYEEAGGVYSTFTANHQPYPTVAAYAVMTSVLGEAKYIGELPGLTDGIRGYLFNTGERVVAVIWKTSKDAIYSIETSDPVIRTTMMGEEKILKPNKDGVVKVKVTTEPIYITYTTPPSFYLEQKLEYAEPVQPEVDLGDYVVLTPFFEGYTFDTDTKDFGHKIEDGTVITLKVVNHSDYIISGKAFVEIPGFTVEGIDQVIGVMPHAERNIKLTLRKTGTEEYDDHIVFTGKFLINGDEYDCSPTAVNVYTGEKVDRQIGIIYDTKIQFEKEMDPEILKEVSVTIANYSADRVIINVNGKEFTNFKLKVEGDKCEIIMDLSEFKSGKHMMSIGCVTKGGDMQVVSLNVRYDGEKVIFANGY